MADEIRKDELTDDELEASVGGRRTARAETPDEGGSRGAGPRRPVKKEGPIMTTLALGEEGQEGPIVR